MTTHDVRTMRNLRRRVAELEGALKIIHTWATFRTGETLQPENVAALCQELLAGPEDNKETAP